jgi:hypothetical protein
MPLLLSGVTWWAAPEYVMFVHLCPRLARSSVKAARLMSLRENESMAFLLDKLCQLCKLQYDENQLDE